MRSLIRPALFMVARLGLLFSVIACVIGQTWQGVAYSRKLVVGIDRAGMVIAIATTTPGNWGMQETSNQDLVKEFLVGKYLEAGNTYSSFGGVAIRYGTNGYGLGAYYWLIITVGALFYILLKFIYRQKTPTIRFGQTWKQNLASDRNRTNGKERVSSE